jgi:predicted DNA-binding transcriptional regulator YafY
MSTVPLPTPETSSKVNISAYRVLYILLLLVQYRSLSADELNRFLLENPFIQRAYNTETLTKYINTLREVGCEIPRANSRNDYSYQLQRNPFPLLLETEEITLCGKLLTALAEQSDEAFYEEYQEFLETLCWSAKMSSIEAFLGQPAHPLSQSVLFPSLATRRQQFSTYRRYCQEGFTLSIQYRSADEALSREYRLEPHTILEQGSELKLLGFDTDTQEQKTLDIARIESVHQLPCKSRRPMTYTTIIFALYGRLAESYRLYPEEQIIYRVPEELHVKTRVPEMTELLNRLCKYGALCRILSPSSAQAAMHQRIEQLYEFLTAGPEYETPRAQISTPD